MSRLLITVLLLISPFTANAADSWSTYDKAFAGAFLGALGADYLQTRQISREPDRWYEQNNPLLGDQPSMARVNLVFLTTAVLTMGTAHFLPSKWRKVLLATGTVVEASFVAHNSRIGLKMAF